MFTGLWRQGEKLSSILKEDARSHGLRSFFFRPLMRLWLVERALHGLLSQEPCG